MITPNIYKTQLIAVWIRGCVRDCFLELLKLAFRLLALIDFFIMLGCLTIFETEF